MLWNLCRNAFEAAAALETPDRAAQVLLRACRASEGEAQAGREPVRNASDGGMESLCTWVEISVKDSGPGISAEAQEHLFEPFYTTKPGGTGLGLATVHRIVEGHGGELRVDSVEGEGASFTVRLPALKQRRLASEVSA